jgi:hypothetical protein
LQTLQSKSNIQAENVPKTQGQAIKITAEDEVISKIQDIFYPELFKVPKNATATIKISGLP